MEIVVKNFLGENFNIEDAIILREELKKIQEKALC